MNQIEVKYDTDYLSPQEVDSLKEALESSLCAFYEGLQVGSKEVRISPESGFHILVDIKVFPDKLSEKEVYLTIDEAVKSSIPDSKKLEVIIITYLAEKKVVEVA